MNLPVPQATRGGFEKIATQMAQPQHVQQVAMQPDHLLEQRNKVPMV